MWPSEERTGPLGLAVSGGPDSLALLLLANEALPGDIHVVSVDHGLRPQAADEVALVESLCRDLDVRFTGLSVQVPAGNLQARAREARYDAMGRWVRDGGVGALATAHHADDQAETLLMRLSRGSGLSGLAGVRSAAFLADGETPLIRPLLDWRKPELEAIVKQCGIAPVRDPSNEDSAFDRVKIRQHLAEIEWLSVGNIADSAEHLAEAWRAIEWYAELDWEEMVYKEDSPSFRYYANVPRVVGIETISRIIAELGGNVSRGEAARAYDRLWREQNASLSGVLIVPGTERIEPTGVTMRVWRFMPEPPRSFN